MRRFALLSLLLLLAGAAAAAGRPLTGTVIRLPSSPSSSPEKDVGCEPTYGVLPCTSTAVGNLFLALVYGYMMFRAAKCLSAGSELLLEILGPGLVGGLLLPILGALPDALLILVSGLSGSREIAQSQVLIGMGLLAGSTVMLLTLLWGSCVVVGKWDLADSSAATNTQDTKGFSLFGSGVSTDIQTSYASRIMTVSIVPFIIVQIPKIFNLHSGQRLTILLSFVVAAILLLSYSMYQIFQPWIQKRRLEYARLKLLMSGILRHVQTTVVFGHLLNGDGAPNIHVIEKLFEKIDQDSDGGISRSELRAFIIGIQFENIDLDSDNAVDQVMHDFDTSGNEIIDKKEFIDGLVRWLNEAKQAVASSGAYSRRFMNDFHMRTREEHNNLIDRDEEEGETIENPRWTSFKAVLLLILGTAMAAAFADPLVDAVDGFSVATKIPSFFISFIAMPLATNSSEAVSAIIFASRKKPRTLSLTFSEIYGAVTMNNTLCLAVFLALVYIRNLTWDFSSEVLVILVVCVLMGLFTSFRTRFRLWTCLVAFLLYPLSLVMVYVLDYVFKWS